MRRQASKSLAQGGVKELQTHTLVCFNSRDGQSGEISRKGGGTSENVLVASCIVIHPGALLSG